MHVPHLYVDNNPEFISSLTYDRLKEVQMLTHLSSRHFSRDFEQCFNVIGLEVISHRTFVMDVFAIRHCQGREAEAEVREAGLWSAHWEFCASVSPRTQTPRAKEGDENKAGPPATQ